MHSFFLKFTVVFIVLLINSVCVAAQNARFIYLQTENREEFYVKLDKKILNSSPAGYLIIPKLGEQVYSLTLGFYLEGPEISTSIKIRETNLGLLLKNTTDKGWTMVNLQTMQPVAIKKEFPPGKQEGVGPNVDEFTRILAEVVDEPSIAWAPVVNPGNEGRVQKVEKPEEKKIHIPARKIDTGRIKKADIAVKEKITVKPVSDKITNSKCKKTATQNDFIKLRKQMAGEANEKSMIKAANKQFLNTCYTTDQIRNLSILFINEEEKYKFFVAAYPYVTDTNNFGSLQDQLTDNYYKTRLNSMIRN